MKLKVYQQGGGIIYTPFIPGAQNTAMGSGRSNGEDDSKLDPLDKEILALMKDQNLLPSDIQMIYNRLIAFQKRTQHLSAFGASAYRSVMPGMLQIQHMISLARNNKENWDKSVTSMKEHDAGSEIALDSYGNMWVRDLEDGGLKKVSPDKFDSSKHAPISYSQLMFFRRSEPDMAFSTVPFEELGEHITGMKDARSAIQNIVDKFGKIKRDDYEARHIADLAKAVQENGYFKVSSEKTRSIASSQDLDLFTQLVWDNLDSNIQHMLTARAVTGAVNDPLYASRNPLVLLRSLIFADSDDLQSQSFDASMSKAAGGASDTEKTVEMTYAESLIAGDGGPGEFKIIQPGNSDIATKAYVQHMGTVKKGNSAFASSNLNELFDNADVIGTIVDRDNIYFGDQHVDPHDLSKIVYDQKGPLKRVVLPVKPNPTTGTKEINWAVQRKANKITEYLKTMKGMVPDELIEEQVEDIEGAHWNREKKVIEFDDSWPFLVLEKCLGSDDNLHINFESPYLVHVEKEPGNIRKDYKDAYNNAIIYGYTDVNSGTKEKYNNKKVSGSSLYRGNIYMPISNEVAGTLMYNHQLLPKSAYMAGNPTNMAELSAAERSIKTNF